MNNELFRLNFQGILYYESRDFQPNTIYNPPLKCDRFCCDCERKNIVVSNGTPPILSHGCDSEDYKKYLGCKDAPDGVSDPVMFLLEGPGGYWDSGEVVEWQGYRKQPPNRHYYWLPHKLKEWPTVEWAGKDWPENGISRGEYFGDYFAYLMVRHRLSNVYITNLQKCSWNNKRNSRCMENCIEKWFRSEMNIFKPMYVFCFSRRVEKIFMKCFGSQKFTYLRHPTAIKAAKRYGKTITEMISENDSWISEQLNHRA